jgi:uncharacterized sulfatase
MNWLYRAQAPETTACDRQAVRKIMKRALWFLLIFPLLFAVPETRTVNGQQRPNILFCFADDWGRYASVLASLEKGPSPNQVVRTPNIDRVAREGVLFRNAFVNSPSCTPTRSSLLSGRYFFNTGRGAILNEAEWDSAIPSFPLLLRDAGYHIGKSYKVWSPGTPVDAPFGEQKYAYEKAGRLPNNFSENVTQMLSEGATLDSAREKILAQVRNNFEDFLAERKFGQPQSIQPQSGQPRSGQQWMYWFGPTTVHRTWTKGSGKALWGIDPESLKGKLPVFLPDVPEIREDFADYLGEVQAFDAYIGVLLKQLEEKGELDRTLIVISGDHGAPGFPGGKCNLYDFGTGVTLIARWPGGRGGRVVSDFTALMDLAPTFLEAVGLKPPAGVNGRSILGIIKSDRSGQVDPARTWVITGRERHVKEAREGFRPYPQRALRTPEYLYIRNFAPDRWPMGDPLAVTEASAPSAETLEKTTRAAFADMDAGPAKAWMIAHRNDPKWKWHYDYAFGKRPAEELYDLRKDPQQVKNVAADPAYAQARKRMSERLMSELRKARDPRAGNEVEKFERLLFGDSAATSTGK